MGELRGVCSLLFAGHHVVCSPWGLPAAALLCHPRGLAREAATAIKGLVVEVSDRLEMISHQTLSSFSYSHWSGNGHCCRTAPWA